MQTAQVHHIRQKLVQLDTINVHFTLVHGLVSVLGLLAEFGLGWGLVWAGGFDDWEFGRDGGAGAFGREDGAGAFGREGGAGPLVEVVAMNFL